MAMTSFTTALAVLVMMLVAPMVHADTLWYVDRLSIHDATGRRIGNGWPASDDSWRGRHLTHTVVEFRLGSIPVMVRLQPPQVPPDGFAADPLEFSGPGCTGDVMIAPNYWNGRTAVAGPRSTVYLQAGRRTWRWVESSLSEKGVCRDYTPYPPSTEVIPLRATDVHLADHFVPPFTIRTRSEMRVPRVAP